MTAIEKVLLRKDVASLIVAIVLGTSVAFFLSSVTSPLAIYAGMPDGVEGGPPVGDIVLQAVVSFVAQLVLLELLIRFVAVTRGRLYKKGK